MNIVDQTQRRRPNPSLRQTQDGSVRMLGRVGNNVNQLARVTNATLEVQPATVYALDALTRVCGQLQRFLDDLERGHVEDGHLEHGNG